MLTAGQSIGNYLVLAKIGTGGMGAVYLAEHPLIGKKVALKVIHRELASNKEVVQRFFQEARAVNKIGNEHIVEIHDFGVTAEGDHFYIMEYLDGRTLASVLSEGPLEPMRALHLGAQIASALAAAHAASVIHRDLKPDNIMMVTRLGDPDFVKVLDFGLAKIFSAASAVKTAAGVLLGTPQYMSPEACEGKSQVDHRTDIYALGVLLFQMMTGQLPFDGQSMAEVLVKQVTMLPPAPRALNPRIPPSVEQILLRCLAKPLDARFPTMQALRDALLSPDQYLQQGPPIQPARSVAPGAMGFDARAVMAHAAAQQAQNQKTTLGMPLPAPGLTMPGASRVSGQQQAATMISDGSIVPPRRASTQIPEMQPPVMPKMNTMRISTPLGYQSRPPRRVWPIVVVLGLVLGLVGGAFAVAWFGRNAPTVPEKVEARAVVVDAGVPGAKGSAGSAGSAGSVVAKPDAGSVAVAPPPDAAPAAIAPVGKMVRIMVDSIPSGADVFVNDKAIGKTPIVATMAVGPTQQEFELRMTGYKPKKMPVTIQSNTSLSVELERINPIRNAPNPHLVPPPPPGKGSAPPQKGSDDGLMRPGD